MTSVPQPGDVLEGKVEIGRLLGKGGMGAVYEALHRRTGRRVAVKVLRSEIAGDTAACSRFLQEALACGRVRHPNVVDILDASVADGRPYLVMELLEGESLAQRIAREGALPVSESLDIMAEALAGVGAAHTAGIVHRDLKPDNLFLARSPSGGVVVKVLDFGISKLSETADSLAMTALSLTGTGVVLGTPYYMSPEQARGRKDIDGRSDVYSAGAVLFHMLTGRPPFLAENYNSLIAQILLDEPPAVTELRSELPRSLERLVRQAMAKKPEERFVSVDAFRERVERQTRVLSDVTVIFTDLDQFNAFALDAPVEAVEEVLEEWERAHRAVAARHGGALRLVVADEMLMTFPTPAAATRAWLDLVDLRLYPESVRGQIKFRAGLARGDIRLVRAATFGPPLNIAARLTAQGRVGHLAMLPETLASLPRDLRACVADEPAVAEPRPDSPGRTAVLDAARAAIWIAPRS